MVLQLRGWKRLASREVRLRSHRLLFQLGIANWNRQISTIPNPDPSQKTKRVKHPEFAEGLEERNCCATAMLSAQQDFKEQRSRIDGPSGDVLFKV
jgi:hypothetical protein